MRKKIFNLYKYRSNASNFYYPFRILRTINVYRNKAIKILFCGPIYNLTDRPSNGTRGETMLGPCNYPREWNARSKRNSTSPDIIYLLDPSNHSWNRESRLYISRGLKFSNSHVHRLARPLPPYGGFTL